jgi:hypothetical protein
VISRRVGQSSSSSCDAGVDELPQARRAAREDLEELQLIVEVVLEPEDDVLRAGEQLVPALQGMEGSHGATPSR